MKIVDGNDDYLLKEEDFINLYNNEHYYTVREICKKLDITLNQYKRLRQKCKDEGTIDLRPARRPKKKPSKARYYSIAYRNGSTITFGVAKQNTHYATARSAKEAELIVEKLKECDWDKSQVPRIKKEVKMELKK